MTGGTRFATEKAPSPRLDDVAVEMSPRLLLGLRSLSLEDRESIYVVSGIGHQISPCVFFAQKNC